MSLQYQSSLVLLVLVSALNTHASHCQTLEERGAVSGPSRNDLVNLYVSVVDSSGRSVSNLPKEAFSVYENGVLKEVRTFEPNEDAPVALGFLVEKSGSMATKQGAITAALLALVRDSNPDNEVFVVNFNDRVTLGNPPGEDFMKGIGEIQRALTRTDARDGADMRDALYKSLHYVSHAHHKKRVLLLISSSSSYVKDRSEPTLEDIFRALERSDVIIHSVALLDDDRSNLKGARQMLDLLTKVSGGLSYFPRDVAELEHIVRDVARDIRSQYTLRYSSSKADSVAVPRNIVVKVKAPGNPLARTRVGFAAANESNQPSSRRLSEIVERDSDSVTHEGSPRVFEPSQGQVLAADSTDASSALRKSAIALDALGDAAKKRKDLFQAEEYYIQALALWKEAAPNSRDVASSLKDLASLFAVPRGDLAKADAYYKQALAVEEHLYPRSLTFFTH